MYWISNKSTNLIGWWKKIINFTFIFNLNKGFALRKLNNLVWHCHKYVKRGYGFDKWYCTFSQLRKSNGSITKKNFSYLVYSNHVRNFNSISQTAQQLDWLMSRRRIIIVIVRINAKGIGIILGRYYPYKFLVLQYCLSMHQRGTTIYDKKIFFL